MKKGFVHIVAGAVLAAAGTAGAVSSYTGQQIGNILGIAKFNDPNNPPSGQFYSESGLDFTIGNNQSLGSYPYLYPGGGDGSQVLYVGGVTDVVDIKRTNGADFSSIEMQLGNGFGANPQYVWLRALNNGSPVGDFDFNSTPGDYAGLTGGGFDEVWAMVTYDPNSRDQHQELTYQAAMIDNVTFGSVPAPGSAALLGLGGLVATRRRRA